jgi:cytochrome c oxidase subunit 2
MGKAVGLLIWAIAIGTVIMFFGKWWWWPAAISEHAAAMDAQFNRTLVVVGVAFFSAQVGLGFVVMKFGARGKERAKYSHGSTRLEITWTLITAVVFVSLAILGQQVWAQLHLHDAPPGAAKVEVVAQQFQWNFHYPGADGILGRTDPKYIEDSTLNYVGLDPTDAGGRDDAQLTTLAIPVNRPVELLLRSKDVIHSFFVPALRFKQDAVPGLNIRVHFTAIKTGKYEITCAELCGQLHYNMKAFLLVLPDNEYEGLIALPEEKLKDRMGELLQQYQVSD